MNESTPPQSPHNPDIRKCIICQKDKDNKGSTENGRDKIISNSIYLEDKILWGLSERETGRVAST